MTRMAQKITPGFRAILIREDVFAALQKIQWQRTYRHRNGSEAIVPARIDLKDIATQMLACALQDEAMIGEAIGHALHQLNTELTENL
jgi:hypothetical protein